MVKPLILNLENKGTHFEKCVQKYNIGVYPNTFQNEYFGFQSIPLGVWGRLSDTYTPTSMPTLRHGLFQGNFQTP